MNNPSRILITGGAGYIGSHCVTELCNKDYEIVVVDDLSEGHREAVDSRATFYQFDINETTKLCEVLKKEAIQAVIHFAACALVGESMKAPGKYYQNNVNGGLSLLEAMREAKITRLVFSSSCATYGIPEIPGPISEATPQNPVNPYGETKLIFERMLRWYQEIHGFQPVIFRYFNAAGAGFGLGENHRVETHLIPNIFKVALGQAEFVKVYGHDYPTPDGTACRDYIHVMDLAEVHRIAVCSDVVGSFNIGTGQVTSVQEVIDICRRISGQQIPLKYAPRRAGDPAYLCASPEYIKRSLKWQATRNLEDCVRDAWEWHKNR